ncbi:MFS transporter [Microlunatus ginsengisoli]|uniref:MFS transporter n=1 Tax=Microlunatus ginsengisoli TaxID=363863 RepID=A0ABP7A616_9ACTN
MTSATTPDLAAERRVRSAVLATYAVFIASGFAFASWASRIPQVRDRLELAPSQLGFVLLSVAAGSVIAMPSAGMIIGRFGSRATVRGTALLAMSGLAVVAIGYQWGLVPVVIGLFFVGLGIGAWDVAMNVQGALAERHLGKAIMPRFHAGFSVGTVAGALIGAGMVALHVSVTVHLFVVAVVIGVGVPLAVRGFLPDEAPEPQPDQEPRSRFAALRAWREPRTLLIGLFVLAFAFAEGTGNDWISLAFIDGYGTSAAVGTLGFAAFLTAMTLSRWFGPALLDRYGRVPVIRTLTVICLAGVVLFVFGPNLAVAFVGVLLWGAGLALGFPVGMSAGADDPAFAAPRVSVIASIGYWAFLCGPPMIGFLGDHYTVLRAVLAVAVLLGVAALITGSIRPLPGVSAPAGEADGRPAEQA